MSFLYATPTISTEDPRTALPSSLRASPTLRTQNTGISVLSSPARSMNRVL